VGRHERRYGLTDEARAARHGYHVPEITDRPRWREPPLPDDIADDCVDWARHRLNQGAPELPEPPQGPGSVSGAACGDETKSERFAGTSP
jgi:hypothetical protein